MHVLAGRNVEFDEPVDRKIAAVGGGILCHVARDIGELEGYAKVRSPVEGALVRRVDSHHQRHRHPDRPRDVVAIAQQVGLAARSPVVGVEFETGDDVVDHRARDRDVGEQEAERVERGFACRLARKGTVGQRADAGKRGMGIMPPGHRAAMILSIDKVVSGAAPGIEQPDPLARQPVEELARERKAARSARDAVVREAVKGRRVIAPRLRHQRSSAFIAKMGSCG